MCLCPPGISLATFWIVLSLQVYRKPLQVPGNQLIPGEGTHVLLAACSLSTLVSQFQGEDGWGSLWTSSLRQPQEFPPPMTKHQLPRWLAIREVQTNGKVHRSPPAQWLPASPCVSSLHRPPCLVPTFLFFDAQTLWNICWKLLTCLSIIQMSGHKISSGYRVLNGVMTWIWVSICLKWLNCFATLLTTAILYCFDNQEIK